MRNLRGRGRNGRGGGALALGIAIALLLGCGAQDLYQPPTSPAQVVGRLALPSNVQGVSVLGENAFVAGGQAGLLIVDLSNPADPTLVKMLDTKKFAESILVASTPFGGGVTDIAFVVEGTEGVTTYDVTDPENAFSFQQGTTAVDGNGLFIEVPETAGDPYVVYLAENWKGLRIFESNQVTPGLLDYDGVISSTRGYAKGVEVRDGYAYVADDELGLAIVDVRTLVLGQVKVVSSCDTDGYAYGIALDGEYAYIADYHNGIVVMEIREEENDDGMTVPVPYIVGSLSLPGRCRAIVVRDGYAFLAAEDGGVHVVDITSPAAPSHQGTVISSYANGVALAENGLVIASDRDEGLIVLSGLEPFYDYTPPSSVWTLKSTAGASTAVRIEWTAPGDDGYGGTADSYDVRYSTDPIRTTADWDSATTCEGEPEPSSHGETEKYWIDGLEPGTDYFIVVRTIDEADNWSPLSNAIAVTTPTENVAPFLTGGGVTPGVGTPDSTFVFEIVYEDWDNDPPTEAKLFLDGTAYDMTALTDNYRDGVLFRYPTTLDVWGEHEHFYSFSDGNHPVILTDTIAAPGVGFVFTMGSPAGETGRDTDEAEHQVALFRNTLFADHEVTQAEYEAVTGGNPSRFRGADLPVENVDWYDAIAYCNALSADSLTPAYSITGSIVSWDREADGFRLPTEAEWEWACRAGGTTAFAGGDITEEACGFDFVLENLGWYCGNSDTIPTDDSTQTVKTTHAVKMKAANDWSLNDMHGNVYEWCWDWYEEDLGTGFAIDPDGPDTGSRKVIRGGSWFDFARDCRSASRAPYYPNSKDDIVGFRVVRTIGLED